MFTIIMMATITGFYFVGDANALLPAERGFGATCNDGEQSRCSDVNEDGTLDEQECGQPENSQCPSCTGQVKCAGGFLCVAGECVECRGQGDCDASLETCNNGVCVRRGGNGVGGLCNLDSQCASDDCGANNLCLAGSEEEPPPDGGEEPGPGAGERPGEPGVGEDDWLGIDLSIQDVQNIIIGLACWLMRVIFAVMVIFLVIAGLRFMAAQGNPEDFAGAKKNFNHVLIGIIVIMGVYVIIATVATAVGSVDFSLIPLVC